jgi:hypothetical protein
MLAQVQIIYENILPNLAILENQSKKILNTSVHVAGRCTNVLANSFSKIREFAKKYSFSKSFFTKWPKFVPPKKSLFQLPNSLYLIEFSLKENPRPNLVFLLHSSILMSISKY